MGRINEALMDLYLIESAEVFPRSLLQNVIIPTLTPSQKEKLFEASFYKGAKDFKIFESNNSFTQSTAVDINSDGFIDLSDLGNSFFLFKNQII